MGADRTSFKPSYWREVLNIETLSFSDRAAAGIYSVTNIPKYRSFQYRLLNAALVTNINLCKWKILDSDLCYFCQEVPEETLHLLWKCPCISSFWQRVIKLIKSYDSNVQVSNESIVYNAVHQKRSHITNFIVLLAKQYIYGTRCMKGTLSYEQFVFKVNRIKSSEKYIAIKNNQLSKHTAKWLIQEEQSSSDMF